VGADDADDAAVYVLSPDRALVFSADFLTPVHDDPATWGRIVAANCLSDIYAMGGRPFLALNLAGFPSDRLPVEVFAEVLQAGADKAAEAGCLIAGGHTIESPEPFYGMAVVGEADPARLLRKAGARPGDELLLTKPLGVGIIVTAAQADMASGAHVAAAAAVMERLNANAADAALRHGASAATDITGFGLAGHAAGMAQASGVELRIRWDDVPVLDGALDLADQWCLGKGLLCNRKHFGRWADTDALTPAQAAMAYDPQTSGGLLIALPPGEAQAAAAELVTLGEAARVIGHVAPGEPRVAFA
jgi:selenide,water dikinase